MRFGCSPIDNYNLGLRLVKVHIYIQNTVSFILTDIYVYYKKL